MAICDLWPPQFVVVKGHNIFEVTKRLFTARGHYSLLWPKAKTSEKSQFCKILATLYEAAKIADTID